MVLSRSQARNFCDRFGGMLDTQAFYEDAALEDLISHSTFEHAESVSELGCGTGRFASRPLAGFLPAHADHLGIDLSQVMVNISRQRISPYAARTKVAQSDGSLSFPLADCLTDRVVATYVFDLLSETDARQAISEACRVLNAGGKVCLVSLTHGTTISSRIVCALWSALFRLHAGLVGVAGQFNLTGCSTNGSGR